MKKRTQIDWSDYELIIKDEDSYKVHWLKNPNSMGSNVKFIQVEDILLVTGVFGRWSFAQKFNPEKIDKVSDSFWCNRIRLGSSQVSHLFDKKVAQMAIAEKIDELLDYGIKDDDGEISFNDDDKELEYSFWIGAIDCCDNEFDFTKYFYENKPMHIDDDFLSNCGKQNPQLDAIFDAFEEVSRRIALAKK
jgi:hypothetical protein